MSTDFWRQFQIRLDPWGADYEPPVQVGSTEASRNVVDCAVETPDWAPRTVGEVPLPEQVLFIDGRRRLDARVVGRNGSEVVHGAFATVVAGAVHVDRARGAATCLEPDIRRVLAFCHLKPEATTVPSPFDPKARLDYDVCIPAEGNTPDAPLLAVQEHMLSAEADLAKKLRAEMGKDVLIVRDGPLRYGTPAPIVGYVKTLHHAYLPPAQAEILWRLELGQRTPLFAIGELGQDRSRWSWYIRTGTPEEAPERMGFHGLHGIVRLELHRSEKLADAVRIADETTRLIPMYASRSYRDARAPQNLTPVGALERELGRRMGDPAVIGRRVAAFLASLDR